MPVVLRSQNIAQQLDTNETFKNYLDLPKEIRTMVINRMNPNARLRLADCSSMCREDVFKSKNIIDKITLFARTEDCFKLQIEYVDELKATENEFFGFKLDFDNDFVNDEETQTMTYVRVNDDETRSRSLWTSEIESTLVAIVKFKTLLKKMSNNIRSIRISGGGLAKLEEHLQFDITSLPNVECIRISANVDFCRFLEKTHRPLQSLTIDQGKNIASLPNCPQVFNAKEIVIRCAHFTYEQLTKMSAEKISIHIGSLSVKNIVDYIKEWINGRRNHLIDCFWDMEGSNFKIEQVFASFGAYFIRNDFDDINTSFKVHQTLNPRNSGCVIYKKIEDYDGLLFLCSYNSYA